MFCGILAIKSEAEEKRQKAGGSARWKVQGNPHNISNIKKHVEVVMIYSLVADEFSVFHPHAALRLS